MKSIISHPILLLLLGFTLWFTSCQKEDLSESLEVAHLEEDLLQAMVKIDTVVPILKPDLVVSIRTNVTATTSQCGPNLPDVSCAGQHAFNATAIVTNIGPAALPAGNVKVKWTVDNSTSFIQTTNHNGIPVGRSIRVVRPFYLGACVIPISGYTIVTIDAEVDPGNEIDEKKENNNTADPYVACNGI